MCSVSSPAMPDSCALMAQDQHRCTPSSNAASPTPERDVDSTSSSSDVSSSSPTSLDSCEEASTSTSWRHTPSGPQTTQKVHHVSVPHHRQQFNWDCGLAVVLMVLHYVGLQHVDFTMLRGLCPTTSIWTVDLAHLMRRFGLDVWFYTVTLGPNPQYAHESFYMENMAEDERRVAALFAAAGREGIPIQKRSLSSSELQAMMLQGDRLVIALVDKRKIDLWVSGEVRLESLVGMDDGYAGHYVLIVGLDKHRGEYFLRDPAAGCALVRVSCAALEQARKCFGTDEDLLCIAAPVKPQAGVSNGGCMEANGLLSVPLKQDEAATGNSSTSTTPEAAQVQVVDS